MQLIRHITIGTTSKILSLLGVTVFLTVYFFAFTATGIAWILNSNLKDPTASITLAAVSGNFNGSTTFEKLSYRSKTTDIVFEKFTLRWNPLCLFSDQIFIESLEGVNLAINLKPGTNLSKPPIAIEFPVPTNIANASIENLTINANDKKIYSVKKTSIDNIYMAESFFAEKIKFSASDNQWLTLSGQFGFSANSVINLTTESTIPLPGQFDSLRAIRAKGTVVGNLAQLRFLQRVDMPVEAEINGRINNVFSDPSWDVDARLYRTDSSYFESAYFMNLTSGEFSLKGNRKQFQLVSELSVLDRNKQSWSANLSALSEQNLVNFELSFNKSTSAKNSKAVFKGSYDLSSVENKSQLAQGLKVKGNWENIEFTLNNNTIASRSGNINFDGKKLVSQLTANEVQLQKLGPTITRLAMSANNIVDGKITFNGNAITTSGNLKLSGELVKRRNNYKLDKLLLTGNNFPLVRKPQAHIIISPEISLVLKDNVITSTGTVKVPMANIQLQDFRETLGQISSFIGSDQMDLKSAGYVDVKFGKSVWMHGYGLNANVTGGLSLHDLSSRQIIATGELRVLRGNYRNLTRKHKLKGGRLKFNNNDIDNPELELNIAQRKSVSDASGKIIGRLQKLYLESKKQSPGIKRDIRSESSKEKVAFHSLH